jgi:hydrogenase small subunit
MRNLSRREFLRLCGATGAALGLTHTLRPEIVEALAGPAAGQPPVVWLQGGSCSGCSVSLLNGVQPDIATVLTKVISLEFHQTLMAANGDAAMDILADVRERYAGKYFLVIEGSVSTGDKAMYATLGEHGDKPIAFIDQVKKMASGAKAVVAVGTCAAFGGIPAAGANPAGCRAVGDVISGVPLINVPGCPIHPDRVLGTLVHAIKYGIPELDHLRRPTVFFGKCVHDLCDRRPMFEEGKFAKRLSELGCLYKLGCKGPMAFNDCPTRKYNNGANWCVGANSPCLACVEPEFPDKTSPFFQRMPEYGPAGTPSPQPRQGKLIGGDK